MRKRRVQFYGYLVGIYQEKLTQKILTHFEWRKDISRWPTEIHMHMEKIGNKNEDIDRRDRFGRMVSDCLEETGKKFPKLVLSE